VLQTVQEARKETPTNRIEAFLEVLLEDRRTGSVRASRINLECNPGGQRGMGPVEESAAR
jgi:hypothetical protein